MPLGPPPCLHVTLCVACHLQVDGKKYPSLEDGIQVVVIDGRHGQVLNTWAQRHLPLLQRELQVSINRVNCPCLARVLPGRMSQVPSRSTGQCRN